MGPFPTSTAQKKFVIVAIDHFTKWVEVEAVPTITKARIQHFFWKEIICRFGLPHTLITDNGKQFDNEKFKSFCADLSIKLRFTFVAYPQTNGLMEVTNRTIMQGLKKRLDDRKGNWADELNNVIWAYRIMPRSSTGETPFRLTYGMDAVIPVEIGSPSYRVFRDLDSDVNNINTRICLDLLEERREQAAIVSEAQKQRIAGYHNKHVRTRQFKVGDLVLRRADIGKGNQGTGKLGPNWEGPYQVTESTTKGAYKIKDMQGKELPRYWNSDSLRKYFQ